MKWTVSNWLRHTLREERNRPLGTICRVGEGYRYVDAENEERLTVKSAGEKHAYRIQCGETAVTALMTVKPENIPHAFLPDRADTMAFRLNGEAVRLRQSGKREFVFSGDRAHGVVQGLLGRTAVIETDDSSAVTAALLYILAEIMLREGDVDVV